MHASDQLRPEHPAGSWLRFLLALLLIATAVGSAGAFFLVALDRVTLWRSAHPAVLLALPLAGVAVVWLYQRWGGLAAQGTHLLVEEIHEVQGKVRLRMAPLVLVTTLITHAFGGSAGREGTAVQMGGSIAAYGAKLFSLGKRQQRLLLMAGIAAGFGAVFGTPWAGAVFAVELPVRGRWHAHLIWPALLASWIGHAVCLYCGGHHVDYHGCLGHADFFALISVKTVCGIVLAAVCFGLAARLFVIMSDLALEFFVRGIPHALLRAFVGGLLVIGLVMWLGTADYLGLGVVASRSGGVSILSSFHEGGADTWSWIAKMLFTVITLASGFKGGEVTPLFFVGAALGNVLASMMGLPVDLFAALGLVAVFAAASKTPLASTLLGLELFGVQYAAVLAFSCLLAYLVSGKKGIYQNQKLTLKEV